jgi:ribosomal protein S18 acetylase RimI-like enzyme
MADEINIRNGRTTDSETLLSYLNTDPMLVNFDGEPPISKGELDKIISDSDSNMVLVAEKAGQIVGFVMGYPYPGEEKAYLSTLYVLPEHRQNGIAQKLEESFGREAYEKGCKQMTVLVNHANTNMKRLLDKIGWAKGHTFDYFHKEL